MFLIKMQIDQWHRTRLHAYNWCHWPHKGTPKEITAPDTHSFSSFLPLSFYNYM